MDNPLSTFVQFYLGPRKFATFPLFRSAAVICSPIGMILVPLDPKRAEVEFGLFPVFVGFGKDGPEGGGASILNHPVHTCTRLFWSSELRITIK